MGAVSMGLRLHAGRRRVSLRQGMAKVGGDGNIGCVDCVVSGVNLGSRHVSDGEVGGSASICCVERMARWPAMACSELFSALHRSRVVNAVLGSSACAALAVKVAARGIRCMRAGITLR